jgi:hypothetical protein
MFSLKSAPPSRRATWAALLALVLTMRLLTPAEFMPAFVRGAVTIVVCPDADGGVSASPAHHHHGKSKSPHQPCPYAAGSSLGALGADFAPLLAVLILVPALLLGRTFLFLERNSARERPPTRAPPFPG